MDKYIITLVLLIFPFTAQARSEIIGYISTDPARPGEDIRAGGDGGNSEEGAVLPARPPVSAGGAPSLLFLDANKHKSRAKISEEAAGDRPLVLGFDRLPAGTLVRDESRRIYIIKGEIKQVIWDLEELRQYRGAPILDLKDSELSLYPTRRFFDGRLIRLAGAQAVHNVLNGKKQQVRTLAELRDKFFGQKIYNVGKEEFALYL